MHSSQPAALTLIERSRTLARLADGLCADLCAEVAAHFAVGPMVARLTDAYDGGLVVVAHALIADGDRLVVALDVEHDCYRGAITPGDVEGILRFARARQGWRWEAPTIGALAEQVEAHMAAVEAGRADGPEVQP